MLKSFRNLFTFFSYLIRPESSHIRAQVHVQVCVCVCVGGQEVMLSNLRALTPATAESKRKRPFKSVFVCLLVQSSDTIQVS